MGTRRRGYKEDLEPSRCSSAILSLSWSMTGTLSGTNPTSRSITKMAHVNGALIFNAERRGIRIFAGEITMGSASS